MFDTLVESTGKKSDGRTGLFVFITTVIYLVVLTAVGVLTVLWFNPSLTDAFDVTTLLAPPPPPPAAPPPAAAQPQVVVKQTQVQTAFAPPKDPPKTIPDPKTVESRPVVQAVSEGVPGGVPGGVVGGVPGGVPGGIGEGEPPPPPPPPPSPPPTPTPTPVPKMIRQSGGVLQGSAIRKVEPPYPPIAKAARAQGAVQVQVTISEEGRVIEASVISGHQLLRDAALNAARQWVFRPTELSGVPVKVQGILTFNFTLN
jgi:protein TonB